MLGPFLIVPSCPRLQSQDLLILCPHLSRHSRVLPTLPSLSDSWSCNGAPVLRGHVKTGGKLDKSAKVTASNCWWAVDCEKGLLIASSFYKQRAVLLYSSKCLTVPQVNPLAETEDGTLVAADAKLGFDDNAAFRHKDFFAKRDASQEDPRWAFALPVLSVSRSV